LKASSNTTEAMAQDHQEYVQKEINPILEQLVTAMLLERPDNVPGFILKWLNEQLLKPPHTQSSDNGELSRLLEEKASLEQEVAALETKVGNLAPKDDEGAKEEDDDDEEDNEDDTMEELPPPPSGYQQRGPRSSVSAEAYGAWNQKKEFTPPVYPKSEEQKRRIEGVLSQSFLFSNLEHKELDLVIGAMVEKVLQPKERIIKQGDDGDVLFVVEEGTLECYKQFEKGGEEKMVKTVTAGDAFGELALLYNCPRAASVESKDKCVLWQLDRETFNAIVKDAAAKKRERYEEFLKGIPLLESMEQYERNQIADALKQETYDAGQTIVRQGDPGDKFYIVEEGQAVALKYWVEGQQPQEVMEYKDGDYFGELALLRNEPRAATINARTECKVLSVDRRTFQKMLGPLEDMLKRNTSRYQQSQ
jgi:cAMP-dependent protein kinase regulator